MNERWSCIQPISLADGANLSVAPLTKYAIKWWAITVCSPWASKISGGPGGGLFSSLLNWRQGGSHHDALERNHHLQGTFEDSSQTLRAQYKLQHQCPIPLHRKAIQPLFTELTTCGCCPFNCTALILRISSYSLEICLLTISHLLKNKNALLDNGLADLLLFNLLFPS